MHKLLVLYPEPTERDAFIAHYEQIHLPLVSQLPGIVEWHHSFRVRTDADGGPAYFAVFEAVFDSEEAFGAAMSSPEGAAVVNDVPNYATGGAVVIDYAVA